MITFKVSKEAKIRNRYNQVPHLKVLLGDETGFHTFSQYSGQWSQKETEGTVHPKPSNLKQKVIFVSESRRCNDTTRLSEIDSNRFARFDGRVYSDEASIKPSFLHRCLFVKLFAPIVK